MLHFGQTSITYMTFPQFTATVCTLTVPVPSRDKGGGRR